MAQQWTRLECEAIVADYLAMLYAECRGETYSKADHRRKLKQQLQNRSDGSIEYKHQNISAILLKADHVYIRGYKPAWNYQALLEEVMMSRLEQVGKEIQTVEDTLSARLPEQLSIPDLHSVFVSPPEMKIKHAVKEQREFKTKAHQLCGKRSQESCAGSARRRIRIGSRESPARIARAHRSGPGISSGPVRKRAMVLVMIFGRSREKPMKSYLSR